MLPGIKIKFESGLLGVVPTTEDGLFALINNASPITGQFDLLKPYLIKRAASLDELGITQTDNSGLHKMVTEFYQEAAEGTPVYIIGCPADYSMRDYFGDTSEAGDPKRGNVVRNLVTQLNGRLRGVFAGRSFVSSNNSYTTTISPIIEGLATEVLEALPDAQAACEWATDTRYAPLFAVLQGHGFESASELRTFNTERYNRISIFIGATEPHSSSAIGLLAGRLATIPVQRNIGRVKDGPIKVPKMYFGKVPAEQAIDAIETAYDKGYIVPRTHVGRSGYYFADDRQSCDPTDDYAHLTNRRVADKAYRIAYNTMLDYLLDEVPVAVDGTLSPAWCASVKTSVETAIVAQMTAQGNLGNDPENTTDTAVECTIDYNQNILSTSRIEAKLRIKPNGYVRWIEVNLGFKTA